MDAQGIDDLQGQGLIGRLREGSGNDVLQYGGFLQYLMNGGIGAQARVLLDPLPIGIIGDHAGPVRVYVVIDDSGDCLGYGFQDLALFNGNDVLECIDVGGVDREHVYIVFQAICHVLVEWAEFLQMVADHGALGRCLAQYAVLRYIGNVLRAD